MMTSPSSSGPFVRDDLLRRLLHYPEEDREPELALCDDLSVVPIVDAVCPVERLGDDRRERRLLMDEVHLARDLPESVLDHRQGNGVRHGVSDGAGGGFRLRLRPPVACAGRLE